MIIYSKICGNDNYRVQDSATDSICTMRARDTQRTATILRGTLTTQCVCGCHAWRVAEDVGDSRNRRHAEREKEHAKAGRSEQDDGFSCECEAMIMSKARAGK